MVLIRRFGPYFLIALFVVLFSILPQKEPFQTTGHTEVIDGDSLRVNGVEIRLVGIDAPEGLQTCQNARKTWRCGVVSANKLRQLLHRGQVACEGGEYDRYSRLLATCYLVKKNLDTTGKGGGRQNINKWMVSHGWAVSFGNYHAQERRAQKKKLGIWSSSFEMPRDWRRSHRSY